MSGFEELVGTAILGIDTLWGGDVMCPSGTGRFIADSWFSDEPLPARLHPSHGGARSRIGRRFGKGARPGSDRCLSCRDRHSGRASGPESTRSGGRRIARPVPRRPRPVLRNHVGPRDGDGRQRRSGPVCPLRRGIHRPPARAVAARREAGAGGATAGAVGLCDGGRMARGAPHPDGIGARLGGGGDRVVRPCRPSRSRSVSVRCTRTSGTSRPSSRPCASARCTSRLTSSW